MAADQQLDVKKLKRRQEEEFLNSSIKIIQGGKEGGKENQQSKTGPLVGWQGQSCIKIFDWNTGEEIDRKKMH